LELRNLAFSYPDDKNTPVLENISLVLDKHEKIGIVGHSGGGKTTLIKVLLGYYPVSSDEIWLDGRPIDNRELVKLISYVPQDTSLFHRSIADNIAYGTETNPAQDDIMLAAKRAHAHEFIINTPKGYDTLVGEKGIKLSMGQRQRIAIARAFLDDKPLLILDEATSALDSESEQLVQTALEDLWSNKTVIAIAHRLSTLRHMDRIVVMDQGRIVEAGTHRELIKKKGQYYRLWQHQHEGLIGD
jgi:ATP-binding cassette subfamily B protein